MRVVMLENMETREPVACPWCGHNAWERNFAIAKKRCSECLHIEDFDRDQEMVM